MQTDRQTDMTTLTVAFHNTAKALKNKKKILNYKTYRTANRAGTNSLLDCNNDGRFVCQRRAITIYLASGIPNMYTPPYHILQYQQDISIY